MIDSRLLDYCKTDRQREIIRAVIEAGSRRAAAKNLGVTNQYVDSVVNKIKANAEKVGDIQVEEYAIAPDGSMVPENKPNPEKYPLICEMVNNDHIYTEEELIQIVRTLKLEAPNKWITRNFFRESTQIPDSAWTNIFGTFEEFARQARFSVNRGAHQQEKRVAAHKSRDHYKDANERHKWSGQYLRNDNSRVKTQVVFSDTHDILIDPFYKRVLVDACHRIQPDRIIMNGDLFDLPEFGRYTIDPRTWNVVGRIRVVHDLVGQLRESCPDAEFWFIEGNHEFRLIRHLQDQTPAMRAVLADLHGWDTKKLLGIDAFEVNYVSKADLRASAVGEIKKEVGKNWHLFDGCYLVSHYKMAGRGYDGTNGHDHKYQAWPVRRLDGGSGTWMQYGCGHVIDADYCSAEGIWNLGFGIVHIDTLTKSVCQQYIPITHIAEVGGEFYYRTDDEMVGAFVNIGEMA
jgi:hypothetical protein